MSNNVEFGPLARAIFLQKYSHTKPDGTKETWPETSRRVAFAVCGDRPLFAAAIAQDIIAREFLPGGRYLYAAGRPYQQLQNCCLLRAEDSRVGWSEIVYKSMNALMTGMGVGVVYSRVRPKGELVSGMGGHATGPVSLMQIVNEAGRHIMQGGSRRSALWAGLHWWHRDINEFITLKNWPVEVRNAKERDFNYPAVMDGTNISVILDPEFFRAYNDLTHPKHWQAYTVYWRVIKQMCQTGEPGFSVDPPGREEESLRNACTEVTSADDGDVCNLGSINMSRVQTIDQFRGLVRRGVGFLLYGTLVSKQPLPLFEQVRDKNRRLGLGLMGLHEWLLRRGKRYGPDAELADWLNVYRVESELAAAEFSNALGIAHPIGIRAIAPTGTIAIIGETTSGIEPVFATAFLRRYLKGNVWHSQYVIDSSAQRIIDSGVNPDLIEDAYDLAKDVRRRIEFQAFIQQYVDQGISSTINLPAWGSADNNDLTIHSFGTALMEYLPKLRGITCYPDGARGGQPLVKVHYRDAVSRSGVEFQEVGNERACVNGVCGT